MALFQFSFMLHVASYLFPPFLMLALVWPVYLSLPPARWGTELNDHFIRPQVQSASFSIRVFLPLFFFSVTKKIYTFLCAHFSCKVQDETSRAVYCIGPVSCCVNQKAARGSIAVTD